MADPTKKRKRRNLEDLGPFEVSGVVISTRVDAETASKLANAAAHSGLPLAGLLRKVLADYVQPSVAAKSSRQWIPIGAELASAIGTTTSTDVTGQLGSQVSLSTGTRNQRWPGESQPTISLVGSLTRE